MPIKAENEIEIRTHCVEITDGHSGTILAILTASSAIPSPAKKPKQHLTISAHTTHHNSLHQELG